MEDFRLSSSGLELALKNGTLQPGTLRFGCKTEQHPSKEELALNSPTILVKKLSQTPTAWKSRACACVLLLRFYVYAVAECVQMVTHPLHESAWLDPLLPHYTTQTVPGHACDQASPRLSGSARAATVKLSKKNGICYAQQVRTWVNNSAKRTPRPQMPMVKPSAYAHIHQSGSASILYLDV